MHLTPLEPGREYRVVVRARNRAGLSAASEPVIVRTTTGPLPTFIPTPPPHQSNNTDDFHHNQKLGINLLVTDSLLYEIIMLILYIV